MQYTALSDADLLHFLQEENEEAFAELYGRYWKNIYFLAVKYTKSSEISRDIVQEVFLKIWINRNNLGHVKEFKPYLHVAARNLIINSLRNKVFHVSIENGEEVEEEYLQPEKQLSYKESVILLNQAIEMLTPQQKAAYQLSRNQGKKYDEIASEMGITVSTVKNHMTKAIQSIRDYLTDNNVQPIILILVLLGKKYFTID